MNTEPENISLFGLLIRQVNKKEPWSPIFLDFLTENYRDTYLENFPALSDFVTQLLLNDMVCYVEEISNECRTSINTLHSELNNIAKALVLKPKNQEEVEKYSEIVKDLTKYEFFINPMYNYEIDLDNLKKFAHLLVEIEDVQTGNIRVNYLDEIMPKYKMLLRVFNGEQHVCMRSERIYELVKKVSFEINKIAAGYYMVEIPEGPRKFTNGNEYVLPEEFEIPGEGRRILLLTPGTRIINTEVFTRKITIQMNRPGEFSISPIYERPFVNIPEEYHQTLNILQRECYTKNIISERLKIQDG